MLYIINRTDSRLSITTFMIDMFKNSNILPKDHAESGNSVSYVISCRGVASRSHAEEFGASWT